MEKLYITTHYYDIVTRELDKSIEAYELWRRTYPRDSTPTNNLAVFYGDIGKLNESLEKAQETMRLSPYASLSFNVLSRGFIALNRVAEAKAIRQRQLDLKLDSTGDHRGLFNIAFLQGDAAEMQRQADWAKGKSDEFLLLDGVAEAAAFSGQLQKAREVYRQAADSAERSKFRESAAAITARSAIVEATFGNQSQARQLAAQALNLDRGRETLPFAGLAFSLAGDSAQATAAANELSKLSPLDTIVNSVNLPMIRAGAAISQDNPGKAIESLQASIPYEFGWEARVMPNYIRGLALLKMRQGKEAAAEFQKILDHRGLCLFSPMCSLSHLQLGRARALSGDNAGARTAYQDFFALWKDADPDIPILKEAKAEYAKLQQ